jgi:hypothetical protein
VLQPLVRLKLQRREAEIKGSAAEREKNILFSISLSLSRIWLIEITVFQMHEKQMLTTVSVFKKSVEISLFPIGPTVGGENQKVPRMFLNEKKEVFRTLCRCNF